MRKKKIKIRQRLLIAFSAMLFFSFMLTGVIFNVAMRLFMVTDEYRALIIYGDRAEILQRISERTNLIMIILVCIMFVMSVIITYFLSNSLTRPIEKLDKFALSIGEGNFATNEFEFNEKELADLNMALNKSVKQLANYDSEQKIFFQNVSHELRTPIMSIKCYAEGVLYGFMDSKQASETILRETDKLTDLVSDLLYISKIDNITTAYTTTNSNLIDIIRDCAARQQAVAEKEQIKFVFDFKENAIDYKCVTELISRVVDNLISNAIRYADSEIILSCHRFTNHIEISVIDDGNGIEPELIPHIFERFYKGKDGIHGMGLAIVKTIVEQHNGSVKAKNAGGGAIFTINLPV